MKIGDTIYVKRGKWTRAYNEYVILGETSRSWIVGPPADKAHFASIWYLKQATKIPKKEGTLDHKYGTKRDHELGKWAWKHQRTIASMVEGQDSNTLLEIAKLIGFKEIFEEAINEKESNVLSTVETGDGVRSE